MTTEEISDDDRTLFRQTVKDVRPLAKDNRVESANLPRLPPFVSGHRPGSGMDEWDQSSAGSGVAEAGAAEEASNGGFKPKAVGSSSRLLKQLSKGRLPIGDRLDMHGKTWTEAKTAVDRFLEEAVNHRLQCVLIISGKGYRSTNGAVLQPALQHWLKVHDRVRGYSQALPRDGGNGAVYVLLRSGCKPTNLR